MICETLFGREFGRERAATVQTLGHPAAGVIGWVPTDNFSGVPVTQETALGFSAVWAATNKIAGALASLPCKVFQDQGNKRTEAREHPLFKILHDEPNAQMDSYTFWEIITERWVNYGTALAEIERANDGTILALHPIHTTRAGIWTLPDGSWEWHVDTSRGRVAIPPQDMFTITGALSKDGRLGRGVIDMASEAIGIALAGERFQGAFFGNGARPAGVLEHPSTLKDEARKNIRREWNEIHQGAGKAGTIAILWEGMKYTTTGIPPEQAQMIQMAQFRITDMARWYDLPPHVIGDLSRSTFCLPGDEEVFTEHGPKRMDSMAAGDLVWSLNESGKFVLSRVSHSVFTGTDEILKIKTENRTIRANAKHRLLVRRKHRAKRIGKFGPPPKYWQTEWVPAGELKRGDTIISMKRLPDCGGDSTPTRKATVELMEFCGLLLGDGNVSRSKADGYFGVQIARASNAPYMDYYRGVMSRLFTKGGITRADGSKHHMSKLSEEQAATIRESKQSSSLLAKEHGTCRSTVEKIRSGKIRGGAKTSEVLPIQLQEGARQTRFSSRTAARELVQLGMTGTARTKMVPDWVFRLRDDLKLAFLRGYLDADGSVDKRGRTVFHSCNRDMLSQFRHLCMSTGISVTNLRRQIVNVKLPNGRRMESAIFSFTCSDPGQAKRIGSHTPEYARRWKENKPFGVKGRSYPNWGGSGFDWEDCELSRIVSVDALPKEAVYDLEVEGTHSFIASGVVVHNSNIDSQQISLVVDSYRPRIIRVERAMRRQLFTDAEKDAGYYVRFILDGLLRGDPKARAETNHIKFNDGVITVNEWRAQDELDPIGPDGDKRFIQLNMTTLDKAGEEVPTAQPFAENDEDDTIIDGTARAIEKATRATLDDVLALMSRKEAEAVERAASEPGQFISRVEKFYETHAARMEAALDKPLTAWLLAAGQTPQSGVLEATVGVHIREHKTQLLEAAECQPDELKDRVSSVVKQWSTEPARVEHAPKEPPMVINITTPPVTVNQPNITVQAAPAPVVNVSLPKTNKKVVRNARGQIIEVNEEPIE